MSLAKLIKRTPERMSAAEERDKADTERKSSSTVKYAWTSRTGNNTQVYKNSQGEEVEVALVTNDRSPGRLPEDMVFIGLVRDFVGPVQRHRVPVAAGPQMVTLDPHTIRQLAAETNRAIEGKIMAQPAQNYNPSYPTHSSEPPFRARDLKGIEYRDFEKYKAAIFNDLNEIITGTVIGGDIIETPPDRLPSNCNKKAMFNDIFANVIYWKSGNTVLGYPEPLRKSWGQVFWAPSRY